MHFFSPEELLALTDRMQVERGALQVWPLSLSGEERSRARCERLLSPAELERSRRFFHERDRTAFVFSHGLMRQVLGAYCGVDGAQLEFAAATLGKPALAPDGQPFASSVSFNLSHSHGRALLAVSGGGEIGVDLEREDARTDVLALAARYFFGSEFAAIRDAPEALRTETFFRFWTAKEAVLKAQGAGLSVPLDRFHVVFDEHLATASVESFDTARIDSGWFVRRIACEPGWHAAVAAQTPQWPLRVIQAT